MLKTVAKTLRKKLRNLFKGSKEGNRTRKLLMSDHFEQFALIILVILFPAGNYIFKVNNRNTRTRCEICSKLTIKTSE